MLRGEVPSPVSPPSGCRFRTRCWKADDRCASEQPPLVSVDGAHRVACHYPRTAPGPPRRCRHDPVLRLAAHSRRGAGSAAARVDAVPRVRGVAVPGGRDDRSGRDKPAAGLRRPRPAPRPAGRGLGLAPVHRRPGCRARRRHLRRGTGPGRASRLRPRRQPGTGRGRSRTADPCRRVPVRAPPPRGRQARPADPGQAADRHLCRLQPARRGQPVRGRELGTRLVGRRVTSSACSGRATAESAAR